VAVVRFLDGTHRSQATLRLPSSENDTTVPAGRRGPFRGPPGYCLAAATAVWMVTRRWSVADWTARRAR